ncbi:NfeD family protein [Nocardioides cynanchi]|uniref:NfeD family protein n=1 Tax=Nocardioides cynanchi TaxID=2558918 RepID=UPI0012487EBE|nr:NfeD family protein [Nocardioides cynanchi]
MEWLGNHLWAVWMVLAVGLGMAEMLSLDLVLLMLAVGAVVGALAALASFPVVLQVLLAGGGAAAMLTLVRPNLIAKLHNGPTLVTGHDKLVGHQGVVTEALSTQQPGRVKIGGEIWSAQPYDDSLTIPSGATVEVFAIRGATAFVHPVDEILP